jgi:Ca-activated chloride channel family protein
VVTFAHPWWFLAGAVVLALLVGYVIAQRRVRRHTMRFANLELLERVAPKRPGRVRHLPTGIILIALILLTMALAGPTADAKVPRNRATVMLAIDVSLSMEATDVSPNRLDAAKEAATEFVKDLTPGVNLGLVAFAGISTVLVSPTTDRAPAIAAIASLKLDQRTATGDAIISCLQTIDLFSKTISGADGPAPARIVMMTDGKRTVGRTEVDAAKQAAAAKIPVSMIAFGTDHGTINFEGSVVPVPLDTSAMQQIAQISGGDFHTAATATELKSV